MLQPLPMLELAASELAASVVPASDAPPLAASALVASDSAEDCELPMGPLRAMDLARSAAK